MTEQQTNENKPRAERGAGRMADRLTEADTAVSKQRSRRTEISKCKVTK